MRLVSNNNPPDHRYKTLIKGDQEALELLQKDPKVLNLAICLSKLDSNDLAASRITRILTSTNVALITEDEFVLEALRNYARPFSKRFFEAFLLTRASVDDIANALACKEEVVTVYKHLFFDSSVFKNELDYLEYLDTFKGADQESTTEDYLLRQEGLKRGFYHMATKYGSVNKVINPQASLRHHLHGLELLLHERESSLDPKAFSSISKDIIKLLQVQLQNPERAEGFEEKLRIILTDETVRTSETDFKQDEAIRQNLVGKRAS